MYTGGRLVTIALLVIFTSACSSLSKQEYDPAVQNSAINRWALCLERFTEGYRGKPNRIQHNANAFCEGHARDVLATYPAHLENQVTSLMSHRSSTITTARYLKTAAASDQASQFDIYRDKLTKARGADL